MEIRKKIERVMTTCEKSRGAGLFDTLLYLFSCIYAGAMNLRALFYRKGLFKSQTLLCTVISVGNLTVGGTGKTPLTIYVVDLLRGLGYNVAVLSRGYKGKMYKAGGIVSDGQKIYMDSIAAGDEPYLIADRLKDVPVLVGQNRFKMGKMAISRFSAQILVMDDGFQHMQLDRDIDLLLLDTASPFGNGHCIPRGPLREPVKGIRRASAIVLTRQAHKASPNQAGFVEEVNSGARIFRCMHVPERLFVAGTERPLDLEALKGRRLFAFSGIGRNDSFRETVTQLGGSIDDFVEFFDHYRYSTDDLRSVWRKAVDLKVDNLVTTEKDYVRIRGGFPKAPQLLVLGISLSFGRDKDAFERYLKSQICK